MNVREILFRGKDFSGGEWRFGRLGRCEAGFGYNTVDLWYISTDEGTCHNFDLETVGQFTGLCDKHGTKIFEGDILKYHDFCYQFSHTQIHIGTVAWQGNAAGFVCWRCLVDGVAVEHGHVPGCSTLSWRRDAEVIGNIHDNPELLKGKV